MRQVHLLTSPDLHSTGHYFAAAAERAGLSISVDIDSGVLPPLEPGDFFLYVDPGPRSFPIGIDRLRAVRIAYLIDVHQEIRSRLDLAPLFDLIFVAQRDYVDDFRRRGYLNTHWLPLACDPSRHHVPGIARDIDVGFVGQLGLAGTARRAVLTGVLPNCRTNDFRRYYTPSEMGRIYSGSKIVLNASINGDLNMRVFEAMAAGALLVTDRIGNGLTELFTEGEHYVGYSSVEEARDRIAHYLDNTNERERIARAGQVCVFTRHTYAHRWEELEAVAGAARASTPAMSPKEAALTYARILEARRDPAGLVRLVWQQGASLQLAIHFIRALGKLINASIPFTPNAIRARMKAR